MRSLIFTTLVSALAAIPSALARREAKVSVVFELDDIGTWFENLVVRPGGTVLATRIDSPEIWHIDPRTKTGTPLFTVPGVLSTTGIAEMAPDVYLFNAGNFSFEQGGFAPGSLGVWKVDLSDGDDEPAPELVAGFPDALFLNGIDAWDDSRVLVGDILGNKVYLLDVETGDFEVALDMPEVTLVNGIRVHDGMVYFVSGQLGSIYRVAVDANAQPTAAPELIGTDLNLDDFDVAADGTIYAAAVWLNEIVKITPDGDITVLAGGPDSLELLSCTSARLGRTRGDTGTVYVSTMGNGAFAEPGEPTTPAKIVAVKFAGC